jgi:mRNA interferase HigB
MQLWGARVIDLFCRRHPNARKAFERWTYIVSEADWSNFARMREVFPTADSCGSFIVFNVGGNKYRLIADVSFSNSVVAVREVLTHAEYDKSKWKYL